MTETPYQRIAREQRERQAARIERMAAERRAKHPETRRKSRRPAAWGTQEWAETHSDNLGESPDY